ncbi:TPA: hypothetical protein ENX78_12375, partial [Candidatus Poribacteria bacterium]|nr:hypothetical protein [Candidatus Poribacteria bacterium]
FMSNVIFYHMYPLMLITKYKRREVSAKEKSRDIMKFIKNVSDDCLGVLLISYADLQATQGPLRTAEDIKIMDYLVKEISDTYFMEIKSSIPVLVTGDDIIKEFGLSPGPIIGKILTNIREAQLNKKISTREEAIDFARKFVSELFESDKL